MPGSSREGVKVKTGTAVATVGTVAMVAADSNRNGGGRQQSTKCGCSSGSSSGGESCCGNGNHGSVAVPVVVALVDTMSLFTRATMRTMMSSGEDHHHLS